MSTREQKKTPSWWGFQRWALLGILCAVAMPILGATTPDHVGKGFAGTEYHQDPYDGLRMAAIIGAMFVSGAAFGAAIGALKGDPFTLAVVGIFAWPVLFFCIRLLF